MHKLLIPLVTGLLLAAQPAHADRGYGHGGHGHHGNNDSAWVALALFGALLGTAIVVEQSRAPYADPYDVAPVYPQQQPVYIEQDPDTVRTPANAAGSWYYCASSKMYYPYTKACPEGWQAVPPRPY